MKFIYSEKTTKLCKIFTLLLSYLVPVKSKVKILQNFVAFSEYMNFNVKTRWFFSSRFWITVHQSWLVFIKDKKISVSAHVFNSNVNTQFHQCFSVSRNITWYLFDFFHMLKTKKKKPFGLIEICFLFQWRTIGDFFCREYVSWARW